MVNIRTPTIAIGVITTFITFLFFNYSLHYVFSDNDKSEREKHVIIHTEQGEPRISSVYVIDSVDEDQNFVIK